jgi:hypothetical protein
MRRVISEWPNQDSLRRPETIDWGVDTTCRYNYHRLCFCILMVACICSEFVMIMQSSWLRMGVGRYSSPQRGVGVLATVDAGHNTTWHVHSISNVPPWAGVLWPILPGVAVGVYIDCHSAAD